MYGESLSRFSSEFFPKSARRRVFPRLVFSGWNPTYLRTLLPHPYYYLHITLSIHHAYIVYSRMVDHPPKEGVIVTQQYVLVLSVSVKYVLSTYLCYLYYLYRLYYWSTYLRGLAIHLYRLFPLRGLAVQISKISTSFNVVLPRVVQHLIFTTRLYKLIKLTTIRAVRPQYYVYN